MTSRWYSRNLELEGKRADLERAADALLRTNRRARRPKSAPLPEQPVPTRGWIPLADLSRALKARSRA
jgi:hypothetical protein